MFLIISLRKIKLLPNLSEAYLLLFTDINQYSVLRVKNILNMSYQKIFFLFLKIWNNSIYFCSKYYNFLPLSNSPIKRFCSINQKINFNIVRLNIYWTIHFILIALLLGNLFLLLRQYEFNKPFFINFDVILRVKNITEVSDFCNNFSTFFPY